ncbi:hypothetical protein JXB31_00435 [Candidatus Woesearchaeota archaeon]|nr:hypothetical protein [Candidatus Woesearchaeota archaeon]
MQKISYRATKDNRKLTDFEQTKRLVLRNSVKNVPEMVKAKCNSTDTELSSFF